MTPLAAMQALFRLRALLPVSDAGPVSDVDGA
jgi:hypothetical protein